MVDRRSLMVLGAAAGTGLLLSRVPPLRAVVTTTLAPDLATGDPNHLPIGMNLAGIADYEPGFPFKNLMLGARSWETENATPGGPMNTEKIGLFELDADGYPLEVPIRPPDGGDAQVLRTLLPNVRKPGRFIVLHDGVGEIRGGLGSAVVSARPGRIVMDLRGREDVVNVFTITRSKRGDHLRNIRVVAAEHERDDLASDPFLPELLDFCAPFHCLRFMDWAATNGSMEEQWGRRKRPTFYTFAQASGDVDGRFGPPPSAYQRLFSGGVAIETMVALANKLKIAPWFCIPHRATDEYIREYARLVRRTLDPSLNVYLEYSNEAWNFGFLQSHFIGSSPVAGALVEAAGQSAWDDAAKTKGGAFPERIAAMFRRAFKIWEDEWRGADRRRLIRVCGVQAGWIDLSKRIVAWCGEHGGADVVAATAYFGPGDREYARWAARGAQLTADEVIADMREVIREQGQGTGLLEVAQLAHRYGMGYVSYEGGQHIQPKDQAELPYNPALAAAQSHPAMYDLYIENLRQQHRFGSQLMCAFGSIGKQGTRWGSWGHKATYDQPLSKAPKMRALLDFNTPKMRV